MIECFTFVIDLTGHFEHSKEDKAQVDGGNFEDKTCHQLLGFTSLVDPQILHLS